MPNLSQVIFPNCLTAVHTKVLWAGLTLALVSAETKSALAVSAPLSKSVLRLEPSLEHALTHGATASSLDGNLANSWMSEIEQGQLVQATPSASTRPRPAPINNRFVVPPGLTNREPQSQPLPMSPNLPLNPTPPSRGQPPPTDPFGASDSTRSLDLGAPITTPTLRLQGAYVLQGDEDSIRARAVGIYPLADWIQVGAVVDLTDDDDFNILEGGGVDLTELYVAAAPFQSLPNLRFVVGQIDFTSYFDRNSFAKDRTTHFFNSVFQSNPALQATTFTSRPGALLNWTITDNVEAKVAAFSSEPNLGDFAVDGFAGELGLRLENFIIRGTYTSAVDSGTRTGFDEIYGLERGNGRIGLLDGDREDAYGINAEYFFPDIKLGLFGRYGHYTNQDLEGENTADTYSFGLNLLDLMVPDDRLGLGYGRQLSNSSLRDDKTPDVIEIFYDVRVLPNLRVGVTFQALNEFSESVAGFRIRTDFDLIPRRRL
ncbi:MAG: carbohydrate porin [Timaviella obliquedivisa GSE-PSE-MK23-08B]|nr:carbohydrate porin [Timaviella obliquedivisa GSE-PSE-MK23-08B]